MVAANNFVLKSDAIAKALFFISVPGFALVGYSHTALGLAMTENVPCVVMPTLLGIIAFTSDETAKKSKKAKKKK